MATERNIFLKDIEPTKSDSNYDPKDVEAPAQESPLITILGIEHRHEIFETILKLKNAITGSATDSEELKRLWLDYSEQFEALAEQTYEDEAYIKIQIAAILRKALTFRDAGKPLRYAEELDIAEIYTRNVGFTAFSTLLDIEVDALITHLEPCPELLILQLRDIITDHNRKFLRKLWLEDHDFKDLIKCIREMLLDDHKNPKEILSKFDIERYKPKL